MYNIVKRNRVKVRSVDYIGYDLLSINFTRNTVKRKNGIDEYPYAPPPNLFHKAKSRLSTCYL